VIENDEKYTVETCGCLYDEIAGRYMRHCKDHEPARMRARWCFWQIHPVVWVARRNRLGRTDNWVKLVRNTSAEWWAYVGGHIPPSKMRFPEKRCGITDNDMWHNPTVRIHSSANAPSQPPSDSEVG